MSVSATITTQPVTASVSGSTVAASVPAPAAVQASVSGGVGPQGPAGPAGSNTLSALTDVSVSGTANGDLLRYDGSSWRNNQADVIDGGNW